MGDLVQPEQVIVTGTEGYGVFQVADGSKFEVFPQSHVVFRANRGDWKDILEVWLGKVRVQIEHPGGLPNHNKVHTPSAVISVRGTIFDVDVEDQDGTTFVLDEEGQVEVRHLLQVSEPRILNPNESVRVYRNEPIARKNVDKGALLQRAARAASDAFYQAALNSIHSAATGAGHVGGVTTTGAGAPADKNNGAAPPPPPPPPPPAPAQFVAASGLEPLEFQSKKDKTPAERSVSGTVTDAAGMAIPGAVVQLKNLKTLQIRSFIAKDNGQYFFYGLSTDIDYELKADSDGKSSPTKSRASSIPTPKRLSTCR